MPGDLRRRVIHASLGLVAILAVVMVAFIVSYWLRDFAGFATVYDILMASGRAFDDLTGMNALRHSFIWHSLATGVFIGIAAPLIGTYLVHREMALIGETLAHTAFAGVAIGLLFASATDWHISLLLAALIIAIIGAFGVEWMAQRSKTFGDVPIAIMLTGSFAVGTIIISAGDGLSAINIDSYLFGNIAFVTLDGARLMTVLGILVMAVIAVVHKPLMFITFDQQAATVARFNVRGYNILLIVLTAIVVVGAMQILGVILVAAMLVVPVAAATQIARSFNETILLSVIFGQASILGGFFLSLEFALPAGGSIVVVSIAIYLAAILLSGRSLVPIAAH